MFICMDPPDWQIKISISGKCWSNKIYSPQTLLNIYDYFRENNNSVKQWLTGRASDAVFPSAVSYWLCAVFLQNIRPEQYCSWRGFLLSVYFHISQFPFLPLALCTGMQGTKAEDLAALFFLPTLGTNLSLSSLQSLQIQTSPSNNSDCLGFNFSSESTCAFSVWKGSQGQLCNSSAGHLGQTG